MPTYLALLRAVNVSGHNKLPMKELREQLEVSGFGNVRTYIQSGNVIFDHPSPNEQELREDLRSFLESEFNVKSPVVLRSRIELAATIANSPIEVGEDEHKYYHVLFLADQPTAEQIALLDPNRSPNDRFVVQGRDIYVHYNHDVAGSKFTNAYVDSKLKTVSTARNWRTVNTLLRMLNSEQ